MPLGETGLLAAPSSIGKSVACAQLVLCIASGRPWLGTFPVGVQAEGGKVLVLFSEDSVQKHVRRRLYYNARALGMDPDEAAEVCSKITIPDIAKDPEPFELLQADDLGRMRLTPKGEALIEFLEREGPWSLIILDPLAQLAGVDAETSNSAATAFERQIRRFTTVPGNPTVLVIHHSSKQSIKDGRPDARGVSSLTASFRWTGCPPPGRRHPGPWSRRR